ncbi:ATP-binding cassette domain-containing protein [Arcobacteraceae bacterium]|nr:ATP-binding cassette domain-containing protein [Arcobacteraceae bacterium]
MLKIDNYSSELLQNISFNLEENQNLIILGSNGAGKTTLAKVLCGIIANQEVDIEGINPSKVYGDKRIKLINYIPAKLEIFDEHISVYEFLNLSLINSDMSIDEVLKCLDIEYLKNSSCKTLSSGESQLLLLASGILHNAKYTIFDEATSNLDPQKVKKVFTILKDSKLLQTKLIITHNLAMAYKLGYDIMFIKDGTIEFQGSHKAFFDKNNLDTFFDGSVKKIDDNIVINL